MKKRIISALCSILLLSVLSLTAFAVEVPDLDRIGSISITMTFEGEAVPGGSLTLYQVADVHLEKSADYSFRYTEAYTDCGVRLDNLRSAKTAQDLASYTREQNIAGTKLQIDDNGYVSFAELPLGLYLLVQEDPAEGYSLSNPFLVSVPGREGTSYIYDVDASPKLALEQVPTEPTEPSTEPSTETTPPDLPQTGLNQWPVPVLAIGGLLFVVLGLVFYTVGKRKSHES